MKHCMFRTYLRQGRFSVIDMTNGSNVDVRFIATEFFYRKGSHGALSLQQRQDSIATTEKRQSHHGVMKDLCVVCWWCGWPRRSGPAESRCENAVGKIGCWFIDLFHLPLY